MVSGNGHNAVTKDEVSSLANGGTSFTVTWAAHLT